MMITMGRRKDVDNSEPGSRANVTVDGEAADAMRSVCRRYRRTQKEFVEFAAKWLLAQDEEVAGPIMGSLPSSYTADFAKMALERMASGRVAKGLIPSGQESAPAKPLVVERFPGEKSGSQGTKPPQRKGSAG